MSRKKILIAGAAGMLGRCLMSQWQDAYDLTGAARHSDTGILPCDLADAAQVEKLFAGRTYDLAVNTATLSDVDGCEREPERARASNARTSACLAQVCAKKKIPFINVSTDYVFDGRKRSLYTETDAVNPVNIYGITKLEGEWFTRQYAWVSAVVRTSWLFGSGNPRNFVNHMADRLQKNPEVSVLSDQKGSPTYVKDLSAALSTIGARLWDLADKKNRSTVCETYHVCNRGVTTRYEMALKIKDALNLTTSVKRARPSQIKGRVALRPAFASMSTARYEKTFKVRLRPWQAAVAEYIRGVAS